MNIDEHLSPDEQQLLQERADAAKVAAITLCDDIQLLMSTQSGRRIAFLLLSQAGVFRSSFHSEALQMAFNEGQRNQGLMLLALIQEHCPQQYQPMMDESRPVKGKEEL